MIWTLNLTIFIDKYKVIHIYNGAEANCNIFVCNIYINIDIYMYFPINKCIIYKEECGKNTIHFDYKTSIKVKIISSGQ